MQYQVIKENKSKFSLIFYSDFTSDIFGMQTLNYNAQKN